MYSNASRRGLSPAAALLAFFVTAAAVLEPAPVAAQMEVRLNLVQSYIPDFPVKRQMNRAYRGELNQIHAQMHRRMAKGENLMCSAEIFREAHWLVNYTDRVDDIERRMTDLRASLDNPDQAFAGRQDPRDGSFGPCFESWIWRFQASVDPLKELALRGEKPEVPLKIWEPVDTPEEIEALFKDLLVSDLASGYNKRKELNLAIDSLGQLLWLDYTAAVFPEHLDRQALAEALRRFVDEEWQDPKTGYWGAWYRDGDEIKRTNDLSITFHVLSYRGGEVNLLDELAWTTFAIRNVRYPYGWESNGLQNNHHAYDVARIVSLTWDHLDETQRAVARAHTLILAARSLHLSIEPDGDFISDPYDTVGEAYYFGVSFLDEIDLFQRHAKRRKGIEITNTEPLRELIEKKLRQLDKSDPMVTAALRKLTDE